MAARACALQGNPDWLTKPAGESDRPAASLLVTKGPYDELCATLGATRGSEWVLMTDDNGLIFRATTTSMSPQPRHTETITVGIIFQASALQCA